MGIFKNIEVSEENPFYFDKFSRQEFIDNIMKVINVYESGFVLSIDSSWGTGKTTFIDMWNKHLVRDEKYAKRYKGLYFNAWENDDATDPLIPLIALLSKQMVEGKDKSIKDTKLYQMGSKIIKKGIPLILKSLTYNALNIKELASLCDFNKEQLVELSGGIGEILFEDYNENEKFKKDFKEALTEYQESMNKKIIIFIDELDRCRPLYAIEILERIKHFFELDNFIFILAMDKNQLSHSISTIYGTNMDSIGYLRRFIDLEFNLPQPDINKYIEFLIKQYDLNFTNIDLFWELLKKGCIHNNFSLRDIDKLFINLKVLLPQIELFNNDKTYNDVYKVFIASIYAYFMIVKIKNPDIYGNIINKQYTSEAINELARPIVSMTYNNKILGYDSNIVSPWINQSILRFLELYRVDLKDNKTYINKVNSSSYIIGNAGGYNSYINVVDFWNPVSGFEIINNLMFTNSLSDN